MIDAGGVVAVIPARSGSKGIPGKNLIDFGGKPLLAWSIEAAVISGVVDRVLVSTESKDIARVAKSFGADVPYLRPREIADDSVHAVHVVLHAIDWMERQEGVTPNAVMMLLPTSPLRQPEDIRGVVVQMKEHQADAVVSVADLGKYPTNLRFKDESGRMTMAYEGVDCNAQRQGLDKLYGVNGSIFLARTEALRSAGTFHVEGALGYVMDMIRSVDINDPDDLELARRLLPLSGW